MSDGTEPSFGTCSIDGCDRPVGAAYGSCDPCDTAWTLGFDKGRESGWRNAQDHIANAYDTFTQELRDRGIL